ncbi:MAG: hypothetical protein O8C66_04150 [Candidatus Methanoperedens sp.]|nr:hypothetical protein [Candidatus Methanoperedens sp.]MCZ7369680.1 hypothetical protein [Candidatus Methanoperedens sp.]
MWLTKMLVETGIDVLDHVDICDGMHFSMKGGWACMTRTTSTNIVSAAPCFVQSAHILPTPIFHNQVDTQGS